MKTRLAILIAGMALACASCNLLPASDTDHGTAQATVTYQDGSGTQQGEVSVEAIFCDVTRGNGALITAGEDSGQLVNATVSGGESLKLSIALGHDGLVFYSLEPFNISDNGASFSDLPGEVLRIDGEDPAVVDTAATVTGTITCP